MVIGILSDNHGRIEPVRRALEVFQTQNVRAVFHCGDIGSVETLEAIVGRFPRCWFVWGNTDEPSEAWAEAVEAMGVRWPDGPLVVELGGKRIGLAHGHEWQSHVLRQETGIHYLLTGHTHRRHDYRSQHIRHINPGALHRVVVPTVATLNLKSDELAFHELSDGRRDEE